MKVGIIGLGFVGGAMLHSFTERGVDVHGYDKYKEVGTFEEMLLTDILFLALPTPFNIELSQYDKGEIFKTMELLNNESYSGVIVSKSTIEPEEIDKISNRYPELDIVNNPEFLTARTAYEDFDNQHHIVLGRTVNCSEEKYLLVKEFYESYYPNAEVSLCSAKESEMMKIFANSFYATKVQFFTELYLTCKKNKTSYDKIVDMIVKNNFISEMHTRVPGPDGQISYGGYCFPKDTNALLNYMRSRDISCEVLEGVVSERNKMRKDNDNII